MASEGREKREEKREINPYARRKGKRSLRGEKKGGGMRAFLLPGERAEGGEDSPSSHLKKRGVGGEKRERETENLSPIPFQGKERKR